MSILKEFGKGALKVTNITAKTTAKGIQLAAKGTKKTIIDNPKLNKESKDIVTKAREEYVAAEATFKLSKERFEQKSKELYNKQKELINTHILRLEQLYKYSQELDEDNKTLNVIRNNHQNYDFYDIQSSDFSDKTINSVLFSGVLTGTVASGATISLVSLLGTASTGTAIASLHGSAAINATLAALGGGSIATGGGGIIGGIATLGGIFVIPAVVASAFIWNNKVEESHKQAINYKEQVEQSVTRLKQATINLEVSCEIFQHYIFITETLIKNVNLLNNLFENNMLLNEEYDTIRQLCIKAHDCANQLQGIKILINNDKLNPSLMNELNIIYNKINILQFDIGFVMHYKKQSELFNDFVHISKVKIYFDSEIREQFLKVFKEAKHDIYIVSPWISNWVIKDEFLSYLKSALYRNVNIHIVCGYKRNTQDKLFISTQENANILRQKFRTKLLDINSHVNTHSKIIICDNKYYISGSFNFLSFQGKYTPNTRQETVVYNEDKIILKKIKEHYFK